VLRPPLPDTDLDQPLAMERAYGPFAGSMFVLAFLFAGLCVEVLAWPLQRIGRTPMRPDDFYERLEGESSSCRREPAAAVIGGGRAGAAAVPREEGMRPRVSTAPAACGLGCPLVLSRRGHGFQALHVISLLDSLRVEAGGTTNATTSRLRAASELGLSSMTASNRRWEEEENADRLGPHVIERIAQIQCVIHLHIHPQLGPSRLHTYFVAYLRGVKNCNGMVQNT
jgi:hypothetical protein